MQYQLRLGNLRCRVSSSREFRAVMPSCRNDNQREMTSESGRACVPPDNENLNPKFGTVYHGLVARGPSILP
jgi:hypothetical protein